MQIAFLVLLAAVTAFVWYLLWPALAGIAVLVFAVATIAFVLRFLGSGWRVYTTDYTDGPSNVPTPSGERGDPAFERYLIRQVWRDYTVVLADTFTAATRPALLLGAGATQLLVGGWQAVVFAPVWLASVLGLLAAAVGCGLVVLLVSLGYAVTAGLAAAVQLLGVGLVRGLDGLLVSVRRTRPACPHPGCYKPFPRPEYACPSCGAGHRDLVPGRYGVLRRVCRCGAGLPTSVLLGRGRLAAACPHCHRALAAGVGQAPLVHLPVVGGPAAGKSTYTHLALGALNGKARFADEAVGRGYATRLAALREGQPVPRTPEELAAATVLEADLGGNGGSCLLYLFDPPGEHYTATDRIAWQRYLDLATGLLMIVDPLSLDGVRRSLTDAEQYALSDVTPSTEDPAHVIDRVVGALRTRPDGGRLGRVAVVVTKIDAMRRTAVGQPLAAGFGPGSHPADQVRDWLNWVGWGNPMRTLDRVADQVRYFGSGLDLPAERVAEPVHWLAEGALNGRTVVRLPRLSTAVETSLAADQIPLHYRILRRTLLGGIWLLTVAGVTTLLSTVGITAWHLLTR